MSLHESQWDRVAKTCSAFALIVLLVLTLLATGALIGRYFLLEQLHKNGSICTQGVIESPS